MRYPSNLTYAERAWVELMIAPGKRGGSWRRGIMREGVTGLMYILSMCCQPRLVPKARLRRRWVIERTFA